MISWVGYCSYKILDYFLETLEDYLMLEGISVSVLRCEVDVAIAWGSNEIIYKLDCDIEKTE